MARILKIARMGHPILLERAKKVEDPCAREIKSLVDDMITTLDSIGSFAGLAAPQVHVGLRVVLYQVPKTTNIARYELTPEFDPQGVPLTCLINPEITPLSDEMNLGWEGCFSVPGLMGEVPRYQSVLLKAQSLSGDIIQREAHGFHARVLQHECDHLDGILFPMRMRSMNRLGFMDEMVRYHQKPQDINMVD